MIRPSARRQPQKEPEAISYRVAFARALSAYGARLAWTLWTLSVMLVLCSVFLLAVNLTAGEIGIGYWLNNVVAALAFSTVGALIASRRQENVIG